MQKVEPQKFNIDGNTFFTPTELFFTNKNLVTNSITHNGTDTPLTDLLKSLETAQQNLLYIDNILKHCLLQSNALKEKMLSLEVERNNCNAGEYQEVKFIFKGKYTQNLTYIFDIVYVDLYGDNVTVADVEIFLIPPREMFNDLLSWYIGGKGEYSQKIKVTLEGISFADIENNMALHFSEYMTSAKT